MNSFPKVSVIVPVHNSAETLTRAINSLLAQTVPVEIVVVDDASTDKSWEIIEGLCSTHGNLKSLKLDYNQGAYAARLRGLEIATAPWVGFLDADDIASKNMYEAMYTVVLGRDVDVVVCGSHRVNEFGRRFSGGVFFEKEECVSNEVFSRFCCLGFGVNVLWNKLYKADVIRNLPLERIPWRQNSNEDVLLNIGVFQRAKSVYVLKDVLHEYVFRPTSVTAVSSRRSSYVDVFRAYAAALHMYSYFDHAEKMLVARLYRAQLEFEPYRFNGADCLESDYLTLLGEAEALILKSFPGGLGVICSRQEDLSALALKVLLKSALKRFRSKLHNFRFFYKFIF